MRRATGARQGAVLGRRDGAAGAPLAPAARWPLSCSCSFVHSFMKTSSCCKAAAGQKLTTTTVSVQHMDEEVGNEHALSLSFSSSWPLKARNSHHQRMSPVGLSSATISHWQKCATELSGPTTNCCLLVQNESSENFPKLPPGRRLARTRRRRCFCKGSLNVPFGLQRVRERVAPAAGPVASCPMLAPRQNGGQVQAERRRRARAGASSLLACEEGSLAPLTMGPRVALSAAASPPPLPSASQGKLCGGPTQPACRK